MVHVDKILLFKFLDFEISYSQLNIIFNQESTRFPKFISVVHLY